ncbi:MULTISPECIES: hypothetical protein [Actinomadura]|uniref:Uncharacterized protein n=1 Tax=Actinomadura yumaensis TaxID=111807 RepID=A0ABW2CCJ2_9ACTN|nr:hypothetical protein [Actinomadura sp. J1-007]MWK38294.1 hypothetical protein [Actinomadura sp. J1-007]
MLIWLSLPFGLLLAHIVHQVGGLGLWASAPVFLAVTGSVHLVWEAARRYAYLLRVVRLAVGVGVAGFCFFFSAVAALPPGAYHDVGPGTAIDDYSNPLTFWQLFISLACGLAACAAFRAIMGWRVRSLWLCCGLTFPLCKVLLDIFVI